MSYRLKNERRLVVDLHANGRFLEVNLGPQLLDLVLEAAAENLVVGLAEVLHAAGELLLHVVDDVAHALHLVALGALVLVEVLVVIIIIGYGEV